MKKLVIVKTFFCLILFSVFLFGQINNTNTAYAQAVCGNGTCEGAENMFNCKADCLPPGLVPTQSIPETIESAIKFVLGIAIIISVIFLIWSGLNYVTSSGDSQKAEKSKKIFKYALMGLLVVGTSYAMIAALNKIFGP